jgi:hypothetical protein
MLDHVLSSWAVLDEKLAARHRVFARDGWRCAAPGCTLQNLHDHHIRFRSAAGATRTRTASRSAPSIIGVASTQVC